VIAVEDYSPEATGLVADVAALHQQWRDAKGGDLLAVVRAAVALAIAPKSRLVDWLAVMYGADDALAMKPPDEAFDMHTLRGRRMGRGRRHFVDEASRLIPWTGSLAELEADVTARATEAWLRGEQMTLEDER
jgi:hypothetical protein